MVPSKWSKALVTAIHKKGNNSDPANYRPVSLTCICCKIMEHIILGHMSKHLSLHNILIDQQHGFREKYSCETQVISAIHDWANGINVCSQNDVILLDVIFDFVPDDRLLVKLRPRANVESKSRRIHLILVRQRVDFIPAW